LIVGAQWAQKCSNELSNILRVAARVCVLARLRFHWSFATGSKKIQVTARSNGFGSLLKTGVVLDRNAAQKRSTKR
jgi:hypothetical protein